MPKVALELTCTINLLLQLVFRSLDGVSLASSETGQGLMMINRGGVSGHCQLGRTRAGLESQAFSEVPCVGSNLDRKSLPRSREGFSWRRTVFILF